MICVRHPEEAFVECRRAALALSTVRAARPNHDPASRKENSYDSDAGSDQAPARGLTLCSAVVTIKVRGGAAR